MESTTLNPKHKEFADNYMETGNATQSVKDTFGIKDDNYASVKGSRLIRNDRIKEYLEDKAEIAAKNIFHLANNAENETVRLNANKDILDRGGFKPTDKTDITTNGKDLNTLSYEQATAILERRIRGTESNSPE